MLLQSDFDSLVTRMGLGEDERTLAEIFWKRAEKAMQGKPSQEAVLLGGEPLNLVLFKFADGNDLTQDELNFMIWLNRSTLNNINEMRMFINQTVKTEWKLCDPENPMTKGNFEMLNDYKNMQRKLKRQTNMLSSIQRKLKKMKGTI